MTEDRFISMKELRSILELEDINPSDLFTEEQLKADPELQKKIKQLVEAEEKKEAEEEDEFIPDVKDTSEKKDGDNGNGDDEDSLIPD